MHQLWTWIDLEDNTIKNNNQAYYLNRSTCIKNKQKFKKFLQDWAGKIFEISFFWKSFQDDSKRAIRNIK